MKKPFTLKDILKSPAGRLNQHLLKEEVEKKKSVFGNVRTIVDNVTFDSKKEAARYKVLMFKLKHGLIGNLELQPEYELNPGGTFSYKYRGDFRYIDAATGQTVVEDVKGYRKVEYLKKRKLMLKIHGIKILET